MPDWFFRGCVEAMNTTRSNNFYLAMLLFMLFLCMLPTIFAIVRYRPSKHCGPFSGQEKIYDIISETVASDFPQWFSKVMGYITSPVVVLPALLLLFMLIYYLQAIARSLKFTNNLLRMQLQTERTDDKKKVFNMAVGVAGILPAPGETVGENKPDEHESDITSQDPSIQTPSPQRNGSITNLHTPGLRSNSIRTITQSASRGELNRANVAGSSRSPAVSALPKHKLAHIPNRPTPFVGGPSGSCRSKSYFHKAYNLPAKHSDKTHSDPIYRKTVRAMHPGMITAQGCRGRRGHATRYVIVNEQEPRKKLLRSATRIPRHYFMEEEPAEILELYPCNVKRYTPRTPHHQPHPHRSHHSQQNLSEDDEEEGKRRRRVLLGKAYRPCSLSDLHQPAHFYIGDGLESHVSVSKDNHVGRGRYGDQDEDEGDMEWRGSQSHSRSQDSIRGAESLLVRTRHHGISPGRYGQSPARNRHMEPHIKPKTRPKLEHPLTESDSASLASSSDQQNSSTDQYIQVIHNKERYLKSRQGKLPKKRFKQSLDFSAPESNDLVCSNV